MKEPKTTWRITWPNGRTETIRRKWDGWHWSGGPNGWRAVSSHLFNLEEIVRSFGGTMERVPNPHYREPRAFTNFLNL